MRTLVIGNGAREHALAYSLSQDPEVTEVHVAPGNPGMAGVATLHPGVKGEDAAAVLTLAGELAADLVVIGPEIPLVAGVADALRDAGFAVFGPSADAARIEGSKAFAKGVMAAAGVRTAHAEQVGPGASDEEIGAAVDRFGPTWVVKDDGLAGGKGVVVTPDRAAAVQHVHDVHAAGNPVLLESFLDGPEVSLFCLVDGETVVPLLPAQDHKRVRDHDEGPNTGGMGAYTPLPWLPADGVQRIVDEVCVPVARQMVKDGCPFWRPARPPTRSSPPSTCRAVTTAPTSGSPRSRGVSASRSSGGAGAAGAAGKCYRLEPVTLSVTWAFAGRGVPQVVTLSPGARRARDLRPDAPR
jgi:phosphoribosylamine--glycine ligase